MIAANDKEIGARVVHMATGQSGEIIGVGTMDLEIKMDDGVLKRISSFQLASEAKWMSEVEEMNAREARRTQNQNRKGKPPEFPDISVLSKADQSEIQDEFREEGEAAARQLANTLLRQQGETMRDDLEDGLFTPGAHRKI